MKVPVELFLKRIEANFGSEFAATCAPANPSAAQDLSITDANRMLRSAFLARQQTDQHPPIRFTWRPSGKLDMSTLKYK